MGIEFHDLKSKSSLFFGGTQPRAIPADETPGTSTTVPVGKQSGAVEKNDTAGLDTFERTAGAEALAAYNKVKLNKAVSTTPVATQARMEAEVLQNTSYLAELAEETGVGAEVAVNGVDPELLSNLNVTPMLAIHLNNVDYSRIKSHMAEFLKSA